MTPEVVLDDPGNGRCDIPEMNFAHVCDQLTFVKFLKVKVPIAVRQSWIPAESRKEIFLGKFRAHPELGGRVAQNLEGEEGGHLLERVGRG